MQRKNVLLSLLLCALVLVSAVSFADPSKAYEKATELFIAGEYEQAYAAFMEIDSTEPFEEWVDRFLCECDIE